MSNKKSAQDKEELRKKEFAAKLYRDRLKLLKKGQEFSISGDIAKAVESYSQYLNAVAGFMGVDETKLSPKLFDKTKDISELFLISHVYWDLAKAYDRSPRLHNESKRCLNQYVSFTLGFKYQYVNARTLKNFIRKRLAHNPKAFKDAYEKIQVESKGCFIATEMYGDDSDVTNTLREFKRKIATSKSGLLFITFYYQTLCPHYFGFKNLTLRNFFLNPILKSFIYFFYFVLKKMRF